MSKTPDQLAEDYCDHDILYIRSVWRTCDHVSPRILLCPPKSLARTDVSIMLVSPHVHEQFGAMRSITIEHIQPPKIHLRKSLTVCDQHVHDTCNDRFCKPLDPGWTSSGSKST